MKRLLTVLAIMVVFNLVGCGDSSSTQVASGRDTSTMHKALLGHWVSTVSNMYYNENTFLEVGEEQTTEYDYIVLSEDAANLTLTIQYQRIDPKGIKVTNIIKFASDFKSTETSSESGFVAYTTYYVDSGQHPSLSPPVPPTTSYNK